MNAFSSLKALGRPFCACAAAAMLSVILPCAGTASPLKLHTNQEIIEDLLRPNDLDAKNPNAVFEAVFEQLAPKVTVYPTESYYYFRFLLNGIDYAGNIRFDAADQFDGKVHFAYANEYAYWRKPLDPVYKKMGPDDGVKVEQADKFHYKITFKNKTVEFELPDLSNLKPAAGTLRDDEVYLGPSWDESGVQFFLVFNKTAKAFLYLLNETPKVDQYQPSSLVECRHGWQQDELRILQGQAPGPPNPDRRLRRAHHDKRLFRRAVRSASGQLRAGNRDARCDPGG